MPDTVAREAYSHEVSSAGFAEAQVEPADLAHWDRANLEGPSGPIGHPPTNARRTVAEFGGRLIA